MDLSLEEEEHKEEVCIASPTRKVVMTERVRNGSEQHFQFTEGKTNNVSNFNLPDGHYISSISQTEHSIK